MKKSTELRAMLAAFLAGKLERFPVRSKRKGSRYKPHNGRSEQARRMMQIGNRVLNQDNRGTVLTKAER